MYGYEDDYRDYYEPSPADEILTEYQNKMKEVLLDTIKYQIEQTNTENVRLKAENKKLKDNENAVKSKERQLEEKEKSLEANFYRKKFSEMLKPFEEKYTGYYADYEYELIPKCTLCDKNREITFNNETTGKSIKQKCECNKSERVYKPIRTVILEINLWKNNDSWKKEFSISAKYENKEDDYRWSKFEFTEIVDKFEKENAENYKKHKVLFKTKSECQKLCNWLNSNQEEDED